MTFDQFLAALNCLLALAVTVAMVWMLVRWQDGLNVVQRVGCGLIGGSSFLIIPPILDLEHQGTPFDLWPSVIFRLGILCYSGGAIWRRYGHEWNNAKMRRQADAHFAAQGRGADLAARQRYDARKARE